MTLPTVVQRATPMPLYRASAADVRVGPGFYDEERDSTGSFWWMGATGHLHFDPAPVDRWLAFRALSEFKDLSQSLSVQTAAGEQAAAFRLVSGWNPLSVPVPAGASAVTLSVNKNYPPEYYPADSRVLTVRLRDLRLHQDPEHHAAILRQHDNACLNQQEACEGQVVLASTPPSLGIDLHGACNVKPPCVYCEWDFSKEMEGDRAEVPFTRDTLRAWGPFFDNSVELINCSIGEPFMMRNLDELLDIFGQTGKVLQMTTNGQILTEHNIQRLLGLEIELYVSLDAATPDTYAKLRNRMFDRILTNLRRLVAAKGGPGRPPYLHLVFMPMRVNLHELEPFVALAADLSVDRLILRPLNYSDATTLDWDRNGHHFEYHRELLPFPELVRASGRAARLSERLGVELSDQMDFGGRMRAQFAEDFAAGERAADDWLAAQPMAPARSLAPLGEPRAEPAPASAGAPALEPEASPPAAALPPPDAPLPSLGEGARAACLEPWKSLYILRRGVMPCCYGGSAIAPMEDHAAAWNAPVLQDIRRELLAGRFHTYCLASPACPIVRKSEHADELDAAEAAEVRWNHLYGWIQRKTRGRLNQGALRPVGWAFTRALRILTDPAYVAKHCRRLLGRASRS